MIFNERIESKYRRNLRVSLSSFGLRSKKDFFYFKKTLHYFHSRDWTLLRVCVESLVIDRELAEQEALEWRGQGPVEGRGEEEEGRGGALVLQVLLLTSMTLVTLLLQQGHSYVLRCEPGQNDI